MHSFSDEAYLPSETLIQEHFYMLALQWSTYYFTPKEQHFSLQLPTNHIVPYQQEEP